jgi:hypothetical protein
MHDEFQKPHNLTYAGSVTIIAENSPICYGQINY